MLAYIIRHGQSYNTHPEPSDPDPVNPPLTPPGREQAYRLGARLARLGVSRLVASPMVRAVETALIVASAIGRPAEVRPGLHEFRETAGYSCWGGRELKARFPDLAISPDLDPDDWTYGGEGRREAVARAKRFLDWLIAEERRDPAGRLAVVTHGAFTQILLGRILRAGFEPMERLVVDNTAVTTLLLTPSDVVVIGVNDTTHLVGAGDLDPVAGLTR